MGAKSFWFVQEKTQKQACSPGFHIGSWIPSLIELCGESETMPAQVNTEKPESFLFPLLETDGEGAASLFWVLLSSHWVHLLWAQDAEGVHPQAEAASPTQGWWSSLSLHGKGQAAPPLALWWPALTRTTPR